MNYTSWILWGILVIILFSIWAALALLIINPYFVSSLPGYTIGRICIWEVVALGVSILLGRIIIVKWGGVEMIKVRDTNKLMMNRNYGILFVIYIVIALLIGIWQFWLFSQNY